MIPRALNEIAESDIQQLKAAGIEEGKTIEYKQELPGSRDEDKREFLADISSFANTEGGDVVYGVAEDQGVITDIVGAFSPDFDAETLRLESLIRDGVSPRMSASLRTVPCAAGKLVIVRVEKSWIRPHRVIFRGHDKFYGRTSAGKFALDVGQLRSAFLESATVSEQLRGFRVERIIEIANDRAPIPLRPEPKVVLHIIPVTALSDETQFDVAMFHRNPALHRPWNGSGWSGRMTFDGALIHTHPDEAGKIPSYAHFYRNGIVEAVTTSLLETRQVLGQRLIPHIAYEGQVLNYLAHCVQSLQQLGVRPPVFVALSLMNVRGRRMAMGAFSLNNGNEIREETLILPAAVVESFGVPVGPILKPMFDRVWNACGLLESPNFDAQGNWCARL